MARFLVQLRRKATQEWEHVFLGLTVPAGYPSPVCLFLAGVMVAEYHRAHACPTLLSPHDKTGNLRREEKSKKGGDLLLERANHHLVPPGFLMSEASTGR